MKLAFDADDMAGRCDALATDLDACDRFIRPLSRDAEPSLWISIDDEAAKVLAGQLRWCSSLLRSPELKAALERK